MGDTEVEGRAEATENSPVSDKTAGGIVRDSWITQSIVNICAW